jgi:phospholipid transport system substrate-binding protein
MNRSIRSVVLGAIALVAVGLSSPAAQAGPTAEAFIQGRQTEVTTLLRQPTGSARDKKISTALEAMMDFNELAKRSLGSHWGELNEAQQKEFTGLLKQLVQRNYERNIKNILGYDVEYLGHEASGEDNNVIVHTRATSKTNKREEPLSIDYRLMPVGEGWSVVDIITEGSSLVNNYRSQFHKVIQKDGYDALLRKMKDKLAKGQTA